MVSCQVLRPRLCQIPERSADAHSADTVSCRNSASYSAATRISFLYNHVCIVKALLVGCNYRLQMIGRRSAAKCRRLCSRLLHFRGIECLHGVNEGGVLLSMSCSFLKTDIPPLLSARGFAIEFRASRQELQRYRCQLSAFEVFTTVAELQPEHRAEDYTCTSTKPSDTCRASAKEKSCSS